MTEKTKDLCNSVEELRKLARKYDNIMKHSRFKFNMKVINKNLDYTKSKLSGLLVAYYEETPNYSSPEISELGDDMIDHIKAILSTIDNMQSACDQFTVLLEAMEKSCVVLGVYPEGYVTMDDDEDGY
jgi:hypothetical protein